jgi:hypothetical protein
MGASANLKPLTYLEDTIVAIKEAAVQMEKSARSYRDDAIKYAQSRSITLNIGCRWRTEVLESVRDSGRLAFM